MTNTNLVKHVRVLPSKVCKDNICCANALEYVLHNNVGAKNVIAAFAVQVAAINKCRLNKILIDYL